MYRNKEDYEIEKALVCDYRSGRGALTKKITEILHITDYVEGKRDEECFRYIYCGSDNVAENSQVHICMNLHLSESTLRRYREKYIKLARYFIEEENIQPVKS